MVFLIASIILFRIYGGQIRYNPILFNVLEMGSAIEAMLFSLALADRIRVLRKEKVLAEKEKNEKQKEMELQALANERQLLETEIKTQELERARIAADLHDELGLTLSLTKISIEQAAKHASLNYLNQAKSNVDLSITRLREITHNLHPSVVNTFGLPTVMRRMLDNMATRYEMKITHQIDVHISLPVATEIHIYRILNELINNVIKHANASKMEVAFTQVPEESCTLSVTDDGVGIPKDKTLRSISARMQIIHGKYEIRQLDGPGTQIIVSFPLLPK
jgi:signal transduction histidine kinase